MMLKSMVKSKPSGIFTPWISRRTFLTSTFIEEKLFFSIVFFIVSCQLHALKLSQISKFKVFLHPRFKHLTFHIPHFFKYFSNSQKDHLSVGLIA